MGDRHFAITSERRDLQRDRESASSEGDVSLRRHALSSEQLKRKKTMKMILKIMCMGAGLLLVGSAWAGPPEILGTPDGSPPAFETVCDLESGAAFGLCNAYCEAMDCDSESPNANEKACTNVKAKYTKLTGGTLPCDVSTECPCDFSEQTLIDQGFRITNGTYDNTITCTTFGTFQQEVTPENVLIIALGGTSDDFGGIGGAPNDHCLSLLFTTEVGSTINQLEPYDLDGNGELTAAGEAQRMNCTLDVQAFCPQ